MAKFLYYVIQKITHIFLNIMYICGDNLTIQ